MYARALSVYSLLQSTIVQMSWELHDKVTADTQVVTHLGYVRVCARVSLSLRVDGDDLHDLLRTKHLSLSLPFSLSECV